jgi:hypothetical protein
MRKWQIMATMTATAAALSACGGGGSSSTSTPATSSTSVAAAVQTVQSGLKVSVFAKAPSGSTNPDSIVQMSQSVFVAYGDNVNPDGTSPPGVAGPAQTEVAQYDLNGNMIKLFHVPGHNDGLLAFDDHTIWSMSNEDANPILTIIDLNAGTQKQYVPTISPLAHGGGLDDMVLINGTVYATASAPKLDASGINAAPAVVKITLNPNGTRFDLAPVLMGNAQATDVKTGAPVTLNLTDPDSEAVDQNGNLVVDSQADAELVFISNPGTSQTVKRLALSLYGNAWTVDDTRFAPASSRFLLFTDAKANTVYRVDATSGFTSGDAYSAGNGTLLKLDVTTGALTPAIVGLSSPKGVLFVQ